MLYIAWMSMENMAGSDIETISGKIGAVPILFCFAFSIGLFLLRGDVPLDRAAQAPAQ